MNNKYVVFVTKFWMNPHYSVNNVRKLNILGFYLYYICYQYEELAKCNRPNEIVPFRLFHFSVSPLNSLIFCFLNVLILSVSRLLKLSKLPYTTINFTVISVLQSSVKSIGKCKKKNPCIINQNNIFGGVYLLIMLLWVIFICI
jgi:hypothetical protein